MPRSPPTDPVARCERCRVGLRPADVAGIDPAGRVYCRDHNTPYYSHRWDGLVPVEAVVMPPDLAAADCPRCARCRERALRLYADPHFGDRARVCWDCWRDAGGDPTDGAVVLADVVADHDGRADSRVRTLRTATHGPLRVFARVVESRAWCAYCDADLGGRRDDVVTLRVSTGVNRANEHVLQCCSERCRGHLLERGRGREVPPADVEAGRDRTLDAVGAD